MTNERAVEWRERGARGGDHVLRVMTDDATFRVIVASTRSTLERAIRAQRAQGETARHFGELLTGMVLVRETMSPYHRVQGLLRGAGGRGSLVADAHPDGMTRGLVHLGEGAGEFALGEGSMLQVMRTLGGGKLHRSLVAPPERGTVCDALMAYMKASEQVTAVVATGLAWRDGAVAAAGGYVVQLLPGAARAPLARMIERLEKLPPVVELLGDDGDAAGLLDALLTEVPWSPLEERGVHFGCRCNQEAVVTSLATIGREELAAMVREREVLELTCDYCNADYRIGRTHLRGLLQPS
jgi:molecular chaperone Hsp33